MVQMNIRVKETLPIITEYYPFADSFKKNILEECSNLSFTRDVAGTHVKALQTIPFKSIENFSSVKLIFEWILQSIKIQADSAHIGLKVDHFWISVYGKDDFTTSHEHYPALWSFVYFIKCPKGSSPLVFTTSGKRVKAEEGKVVIFPANMFHHVLKNKCDDRIVLAGNVFWY